MENKYKIAIASVVVVAAFAVGRYTVPEKVRVETKTEYVQVEHTVVVDNSHSTTHTHVNPDGSSDSTTTTDNHSHSSTDNSTHAETDATSETIRGSQKLTLSALAGTQIGEWQPVYGASITKPVFGPVTVGFWGLSNKTVGASLGLTF